MKKSRVGEAKKLRAVPSFLQSFYLRFERKNNNFARWKNGARTRNRTKDTGIFNPRVEKG